MSNKRAQPGGRIELATGARMAENPSVRRYPTLAACLVALGLLSRGHAAESPGSAASEPAPEPAPELTLAVLIVNDPDLPVVSMEDARAIFAEARRTMRNKLGYDAVAFDIRDTISSRELIERYSPKDDACLARLTPLRVRPGVRRAADMPRDKVLAFLKRWDLSALRAFFPSGQRKALDSHEVIASRLLEEMDRKIAAIGDIKLPSGASLLAPEALEQRSYVRWLCALRNQSDYDFILTNAFVLYDLGSEPFPHSVFQKNKVGGASLFSPGREPLRGQAVFASTFSMVTDLPFFQEPGLETLRPKERFEVIGSFIVAHELGHALFKLPDFYDHPAECLMTTQFETDYVTGYWHLQAQPGRCGKCEPWVQARREVFLADLDEAKGDFAGAAAHLQRAIKMTPKHIDGSYPRYIAGLSAEVAELLLRAGKKAEAQKWAAATLRVMPDSQRALEVQRQLATPAPPVNATPAGVQSARE